MSQKNSGKKLRLSLAAPAASVLLLPSDLSLKVLYVFIVVRLNLILL